MLDFIRQKKFLILVIFATLACVIGIGYFFANKKSQPYFRSKIEKIMYDTHNTSPKYVITLPDKSPKVTAPKKDKIVPIQTALIDNKKDETPHKIDVVMKHIPHLSDLGEAKGQEPLKYVNLAANMTEKKGNLFLPKIDGKDQPWELYGCKVKVKPQFHRVAVVLKNMGLNAKNADFISKGLPAEISFSFSPYAPEIDEQIINSRQRGHETYMDLLLPSKNYLTADSGPMAISLTASLKDNLKRLEKIIGVNAPIGGLVVNSGVADDSNAEQLEAIFQEVEQRGLLTLNATQENYIEDIESESLVATNADLVLDRQISTQNLEKLFQKAEKIAEEKGSVIIVCNPKPIAVMALKKWIESFSPQLSYEEMKEKNITEIEKPFALVPLSNLVSE